MSRLLLAILQRLDCDLLIEVGESVSAKRMFPLFERAYYGYVLSKESYWFWHLDFRWKLLLWSRCCKDTFFQFIEAHVIDDVG